MQAQALLRILKFHPCWLSLCPPTSLWAHPTEKKPWQIKARDGEREGVPASALPPTLSLDASSFRRQLGMCQTWSCYLAFLLPKIMKSSPSAKPSPSLSGSISSRCGLHTHRIRKKYCGEELSILSFSLTFYSFFFIRKYFFHLFYSLWAGLRSAYSLYHDHSSPLFFGSHLNFEGERQGHNYPGSVVREMINSKKNKSTFTPKWR